MWPSHKSVVVDIDDPVFTPAEVYALNMPQVKAIVVTTEKAKQIFRDLGVNRPIHVVPQGVSIGHTDRRKIQEIRRQFKGDGDMVVGYHAPTLTLSCDGPRRMRNGVDDLDLLFNAVEAARRAEPQIKLWLLGETSQSVKKFGAGKPWIKLFGYVPFSDVLNYVSNFDIAVYPRTYTLPPGRFSVKISQYMACGIPIISTNVDESFIVKEVSCGIVCNSQGEFCEALINSARSPEMRSELGKFGRMHAEANLDWSLLVRRYENILMK
jgi:glycosyltransferase involved in cell wall biosynthesis